jgi:uncharacterized protein (TIGR02453 family)
MARPTTETAARSFGPELFRFLRDLKANNTREWFAENKERYEDAVRGPALDFVSDFAPRLEEISPHFIADPRPSGGSLFRIHRDTRFSRDKSPYKTHTGIQFRHELGRDAHAPGFYLHLEPKAVFAGAGVWHPDGTALAAIRDAIVADPDGWRSATSGQRAFRRELTLGGDSLKRAPAGYDPEHPLVEDLKRKDFVCYRTLEEREVCSAGFAEQLAGVYRAASPLVRFLCSALDVPF